MAFVANRVSGWGGLARTSAIPLRIAAMADTQRPLSPHLQIYRKQVQMMTSITHRATGIALAVGTLLVVCGLLHLAAGEESFNRSEERRVGKECVSTCRSRWSPYH